MSLSPAAFFGLLDETNPVGSDSRTISDNQHRNILDSCKQQGPNWTGAISSTHEDVNLLSGYVASGIKPMPGQGGATVLFSYNTDTPPAGWTVEEPDTNLRELIIGPAAGGATIGGSMDPTNMSDSDDAVSVVISGDTAGVTLTADQSGVPAHTHIVDQKQNPSGAANASHGGTGNDAVDVVTQQNTPQDAAQAHSHGAGTLSGIGTATITMTPRYARGILMKLNA